MLVYFSFQQCLKETQLQGSIVWHFNNKRFIQKECFQVNITLRLKHFSSSCSKRWMRIMQNYRHDIYNGMNIHCLVTKNYKKIQNWKTINKILHLNARTGKPCRNSCDLTFLFPPSLVGQPLWTIQAIDEFLI